MSIFTINYLYDISEYDQSLLDIQQKGLTKLKQQTKINKKKFRSSRYPQLSEMDQEALNNRISLEENQFIKQTLKNGEQQEKQKNQVSPFLNEQSFRKKTQMEKIKKQQNPQKSLFTNKPAQSKENEQNLRQQIYKQVIQRRYERVKKSSQRDYFNSHFDI